MRVPERRVPPATGPEDPATTVCDATPPTPYETLHLARIPARLEPALRRSLGIYEIN